MKKPASCCSTKHGNGGCAVASHSVAGQADICACAHGRHFAAGGCTNIAGDVATGAAIAAATDPYVPGEIPCYTVEGVPIHTSWRPLLIGAGVNSPPIKGVPTSRAGFG